MCATLLFSMRFLRTLQLCQQTLHMSLAESFHLEAVVLTLLPSIPDGITLP